MEKYILKITLAVVIIILLCVYCSNIFSLSESKGYEYNVNVGKAYESQLSINASKESNHITGDVYFKIDRNEDVIVLERNYNFAKVSKEIDDDLVYGYIDAWYLSEDAKSIRMLEEPTLSMIEDANVYYTASATYQEKYKNTYTGLVKVLAKCNGYSLIKIVDYDIKANDTMWVLDEDLKSYNALRINVGFANEDAKMYVDTKFEERASETLREKILSANLLKITEDLDEYVKVQDESGDFVYIKKVDFNVVQSASQVK